MTQLIPGSGRSPEGYVPPQDLAVECLTGVQGYNNSRTQLSLVQFDIGGDDGETFRPHGEESGFGRALDALTRTVDGPPPGRELRARKGRDTPILAVFGAPGSSYEDHVMVYTVHGSRVRAHQLLYADGGKYQYLHGQEVARDANFSLSPGMHVLLGRETPLPRGQRGQPSSERPANQEVYDALMEGIAARTRGWLGRSAMRGRLSVPRQRSRTHN